MTADDLETRVAEAMTRSPLHEISAAQREELLAFLAEADVFEDLPGKWQAAIAAAESGGSGTAHGGCAHHCG